MSQMYDVHDVADFLKISEPTVRRLIKDKESKFPAPRRVGGSLRWLQSDLENYVAALREPENQ